MFIFSFQQKKVLSWDRNREKKDTHSKVLRENVNTWFEAIEAKISNFFFTIFSYNTRDTVGFVFMVHVLKLVPIVWYLYSIRKTLHYVYMCVWNQNKKSGKVVSQPKIS